MIRSKVSPSMLLSLISFPDSSEYVVSYFPANPSDTYLTKYSSAPIVLFVHEPRNSTDAMILQKHKNFSWWNYISCMPISFR